MVNSSGIVGDFFFFLVVCFVLCLFGWKFFVCFALINIIFLMVITW